MIEDRLRKVSSLSDRKLLKDVLFDVYSNLVDYNMSMYERLEERLYNEIDDPLGEFALYTSLEHLENLDPVSEFLHPMIPTDASPNIDLRGIGEDFAEYSENIIASVFMECSSGEISRFLKEQKLFKGKVTTNQSVHDITAMAKPCNKYINQIENLYRVFQKNSVIWTTVNCPYAYKFIDIVLAAPVNLAEDEIISEITVDLGEYDKYKKVNMIPVWNVKTVETAESSFPMPAIDRINFEHHLPLEEFGVQNGYLIASNNPDYSYTKRLEKELIAISADDSKNIWQLLQIENISNMKKRNMAYEMFTNKRDMGFVGRFASVKSIIVRTMGELDRILCSYEQSKTVKFLDLEILEPCEIPHEAINYNSFIDDNIRRKDANKKIMRLMFKVTSGKSFLGYDKISFLVSEVQMLYPEYKCIGEAVS